MSQKTTWFHYIGGSYKTDRAFLQEAERIRALGLPGVSRKMPPQNVKQMQFGDRIVFLRWLGKMGAYAFAEGIIEGVGLPTEIQAVVSSRLIAEGRAQLIGGGGGGESKVERECGQYQVSGGGCSVDGEDVPLREIVSLAEEAAQQTGQKLFTLVNIRISKEYPAPAPVSPTPSFTRSVIRVGAFDVVQTDDAGIHEVVGVTEYVKAPRRSKFEG